MKTPAACLLLTMMTQAAGLSDADIAAAIAEGARLKQQTHKIGFTKAGANGGFHIFAYGPLGRIALFSAEAAAAFLPFTPDKVTPEMTAQTLMVKAEPVTPGSTGVGLAVPSPVRTIVIRQKGAEAVLQPLTLTREPRSWSNALGGTFQSEAATATFDMAALPAGDLEILTVGERGSDVATIKAQDRRKIR